MFTHIYITKIMEYVYVCVCVCMYVCPAMRFAKLRGMGLKLGMGIGDGPPRLKSIFSKWPPQRSSSGQVALEMPYGYQIWLEESLPKSNALLGSTRGQIA